MPGPPDLRVMIVEDQALLAMELELVLALRFPTGADGGSVSARFVLEDREGVLDAAPEHPSWTYASHAENDRQRRTIAVDRVVARLYAARARADALDLNRDGDLEGARRVLRATAKRIRSYAGEDRELLDLAKRLEHDSERYSETVLSAPTSKPT